MTQNAVGLCKQNIIVILYQVKSGLVTLTKCIYALTEVSNIYVLVACFELINFVFQVPGSYTTSIMFHIIQTVSVQLT
jgi:hypothetical protein